MFEPIRARVASSWSKNGIILVVIETIWLGEIASYAKINEYGFIMTPYRRVVDCHVTDEIVYMTADEEQDYYIGQATITMDNPQLKQ